MSALVWRIDHFDEIDSTNTWLRERAHEGAPEGLVAWADYQRAGRGRLDRVWESPPRSSLLCSILLRPRLDASQLQLAVAAVALAARAALVRLSGVRPSLKWPNDLMVGDSKLAGILAELVVDGDDVAVVVGIGVNLTAAGPPGTDSTSVWAAAGVTITPNALLDILLDELESRRTLLDDEPGRAALREEYLRALATLGQRVRVVQPWGETVGVATSVDDSGRLVVLVDGTPHTFEVGDVVHVRRDDGGDQ